MKLLQSGGRALLGRFAVALFALLTLPRLLSHGMFVDGLVYAAISRNLAVGRGSMWQPYFSQTRDAAFFEHPPLAFWLQALAYRLFGDTPRVEAFYGFFAGLLVLLGMWLIWRALRSSFVASSLCAGETGSTGNRHSGAWLPITLFTVMPITTWCFSNNMLENTMTVWTTFALLMVIVGVRSQQGATQVVLGSVAGVLVMAAFLTKGPTGLFPLAAPLMALVLHDVRRQAVLRFYLGMVAAMGGVIVLLGMWDAPQAAVVQYLKQQVIASLAGQRANHTRLYIVAMLAGELTYALVLCTLIWIVLRRQVRLTWTRQHTFLLLVALSASGPVLLSTKQNTWYVFQSLPVYALLLGAVMSPAGVVLERLVEHARVRGAVTVVTIVLVIAAVTGMFTERDKVRKHEAFFPDFVLQPLALPSGAVVAACPTKKVDYAMLANFARYFDISLDLTAAPAGNLYLAELNSQCDVPPTCQRIHPPRPHAFELFDCRAVE